MKNGATILKCIKMFLQLLNITAFLSLIAKMFEQNIKIRNNVGKK